MELKIPAPTYPYLGRYNEIRNPSFFRQRMGKQSRKKLLHRSKSIDIGGGKNLAI